MNERTGQTELLKKDGETEKETTKTEQILLTFILFSRVSDRYEMRDTGYGLRETRSEGIWRSGIAIDRELCYLDDDH